MIGMNFPPYHEFAKQFWPLFALTTLILLSVFFLLFLKISKQIRCLSLTLLSPLATLLPLFSIFLLYNASVFWRLNSESIMKIEIEEISFDDIAKSKKVVTMIKCERKMLIFMSDKLIGDMKFSSVIDGFDRLMSSVSLTGKRGAYEDGYRFTITAIEHGKEIRCRLSVFDKSYSGHRSVVIPYLKDNFNNPFYAIGEYGCPEFAAWTKRQIKPLFLEI